MDGRPEGPLRRLARPNLDEATEPVDVTFRSTLAGPERPQVKGARLVAGRARDVDQSMIQGERHVLGAQLREDVGGRGENREAGTPSSRPVADAEEGRLPYDVLRASELVQADDTLREQKPDVLLQSFFELARPVTAALFLDGPRAEPDLSIANLHEE